MPRIVSVSTAPYDGWDFAATFESLARCGATHVEPAFIVGYTEPFDDAAFDRTAASRLSAELLAAGLRCHALSAHIDLGRPDAVDLFRARMDFAARIGAAIVNTNAAIRENEAAFFRNVEPIGRHAAELGLVVALENPGDGRPNLVDRAADGIALVRRIGSPHVALNHDGGNLASHRPEIDPATDLAEALPFCAGVHLKAVRRTAEGFVHLPLDPAQGYDGRLVDQLRARPELPVGIELPLRMCRGADAQPWRRVARWPLETIESAVRASLTFVRSRLHPEGSAS